MRARPRVAPRAGTHADVPPRRAWRSAGARTQVVDEADRLLNQSYQEWLSKVLAAADTAVAPDARAVPAGVALRYHPERPDEADALRVPVRSCARLSHDSLGGEGR